VARVQLILNILLSNIQYPALTLEIFHDASARFMRLEGKTDALTSGESG